MASAPIDILIEQLRANPIIQGATPLAMRARMAEAVARAPVPEDVEFRPVDAGGVPAEWTAAPGASDDRCVVYFHGGAYVMGSLDSHRLLVSQISRAAGVRVLSVDYRLAPEHPHPAAVEDAMAAYRFVREGGLPARSVAFAGDSAGGGLTLGSLVALRDAGEELPAAAVAISPWLDLALTGDSLETRADEDPMLDPEQAGMLAAAYLAGADPRTPTASPLYADPAGLPPLLLQVGTAEVLLDDSVRFAERAREAGADVELQVWDDMIHVWHAFFPVLPEGARAIEGIGAFLKERLAPSS